MSIFDKFGNKPVRLDEMNLEPFFSYKNTVDNVIEITYIPVPINGCDYCGVKSEVSNGNGGCVACGAPLPEKKEKYRIVC